MTNEYRAVATLKAKSGSEQALRELTLELLPKIRTVDGLNRVEFSTAIDDPTLLVLYYWWESPEHSRRYVEGSLYGSFMPRLMALVANHTVAMLQRVA